MKRNEMQHIVISKKTHEKLKLYAFAVNKTIGDIGTEAIEEYMKNHPVNNEKFKKILEIEEV